MKGTVVAMENNLTTLSLIMVILLLAIDLGSMLFLGSSEAVATTKYGMSADKRPGVAVQDMRKIAKEIRLIDSKDARWIASDAIRELEGEVVQKRFERKSRGNG
jgi:hypothetical protein